MLMNTKNAGPTKCECGKTGTAIEHTTVNRYSQNWKQVTVTTVDREVHCDGHMSISRTVSKRVE